jgi:hypothetical protein
MERAGRRIWGYAAGATLFVVALAVGLWLAWPHERRLLSVAHPVLKVDMEREAWYWLSAHQLLILTTDHENRPGNPHWTGHADLLDTNTHVQTRLEGLSALFAKPDMSPMDPPANFQLSPNGQKLYWYNQRGSGRTDLWFAAVANLDGTHYREWPDDAMSFPNYWLDSQHYVEAWWKGENEANYGKVDTVHVFDVENSQDDKIYPVSSSSARALLKQYYDSHPTLVEVDRSSAHPTIEVFRTERRYVRPKQILRSYPLALPEDASLERNDVNPQQNAIVYFVRFSKVPSWTAQLHRWFASFPARPIVTDGLWISGADGKDFHEIGHVPSKSDASGAPEEQLTVMEWLPDGKQVSFVYQDTLYVVPAGMEK